MLGASRFETASAAGFALFSVSVRWTRPNAGGEVPVVSTIDSGHDEALHGGQEQKAVLVGRREAFDLPPDWSPVIFP